MHCPQINDLPKPFTGRQAFPWTEGTPATELLSCSRVLPRISIVTPSLNQGQFLEETIRSVLLQGYPNFEYIIIDGGSTDNSVEIIRKYEPWLTYWVSEPDGGQSDAINKGMQRATGDILAYLNSDDLYLPNALNQVVKMFTENEHIDIIFGNRVAIDGRSEVFPPWIYYNDVLEKGFQRIRLLYWHNYISQPAVFWKHTLTEDIGLFDNNLHLIMDYDYWVRAVKAHKNFYYMNQPLAKFRYHCSAKTPSAGGEKKFSELKYVCTKNKIPFSYYTQRVYRYLELNLFGKIAVWKKIYRYKGLKGIKNKLSMSFKRRFNSNS